MVATSRSTTVTVPRRLAHTERRSSFSTCPPISVLAGSDSTRPHPQQVKVRLDPGQSIHLRGDGIPYEEVHSPSTTGTNRSIEICCSNCQRQSISMARQFLSILGSINAAADLVSYGRLHLRPLQWELALTCLPTRGNLSDRIQITHTIREHLNWWIISAPLSEGVPIIKPDPAFQFILKLDPNWIWRPFLKMADRQI